MAEIKIIFSTGDTKRDRLGSRFLRWVTRCEYSHCELLYGEYIVGARSAGTEKYEISELAKVNTVKTLECTEDQKKIFDDFIHEQVGKGYDWRAYLGFLFSLSLQHHILLGF